MTLIVQYLVSVNYIHYNAAFQHLCEASLDGKMCRFMLISSAWAMPVGGGIIGHIWYSDNKNRTSDILNRELSSN